MRWEKSELTHPSTGNSQYKNRRKYSFTNLNIGTLSAQELFFQLIGLLGVRLDVSPVGMVELFVHGASLTT